MNQCKAESCQYSPLWIGQIMVRLTGDGIFASINSIEYPKPVFRLAPSPVFQFPSWDTLSLICVEPATRCLKAGPPCTLNIVKI